jgi:ABC-type multidrug transport system ATPase subunit
VGLAAEDTPVVHAAGLVRSFAGRPVLRDLSLTVGRGERVALTGRNGAGKTTMLRCVAGTLSPSAGELLIGGHPAGSIEARRLIGVSLSQERSFYLRLTGRANLLLFARFKAAGARDARRQVASLIDELELEEIVAKRVHDCSTGMLQQLAFARSLLGDPTLLLLDEPTRSLDTEAVARLWAALDRRPDTAVMIATHRSDDVDRCDSRVQL